MIGPPDNELLHVIVVKEPPSWVDNLGAEVAIDARGDRYSQSILIDDGEVRRLPGSSVLSGAD